MPLTLKPGEGLLLFDDETGESLFNITFGRNLPGPDENYALFSTALAGEAEAAKKAAATKGNGHRSPPPPRSCTPRRSRRARPARPSSASSTSRTTTPTSGTGARRTASTSPSPPRR
ncbi:hypothetical protein V2I01_28115 [Micromonospora sp. BRA006-A]|nr:hypothetical protein [Micromonospora sp. BRA006-A]